MEIELEDYFSSALRNFQEIDRPVKSNISDKKQNVFRLDWFDLIIDLINYLHHKCCQASQRGQQCHAPQHAHADLIEQKKSSPAQLFGSVRGVTHAVDSLHAQLLDQTAAHVAELVKAVPAVVAAHTAVT